MNLCIDCRYCSYDQELELKLCNNPKFVKWFKETNPEFVKKNEFMILAQWFRMDEGLCGIEGSSFEAK